MSGWGIADTALDIEKIKAESADYLRGLNSCGEIGYAMYDQAFDFYMGLLDKAYTQGKKDAFVIKPDVDKRKTICDIAGVADIGELSDGFHTFNSLYEQRLILFAALVKAYKDKAWKSYRHEDGEYCFGGGWFIVGIDTPEGSYTYHYENKYWDMFDCADLPRGKHWDGHTEADAETRLMSLNPEKTGKWLLSDAQRSEDTRNGNYLYFCSNCLRSDVHAKTQKVPHCWWCGAKMESKSK